MRELTVVDGLISSLTHALSFRLSFLGITLSLLHPDEGASQAIKEKDCEERPKSSTDCNISMGHDDDVVVTMARMTLQPSSSSLDRANSATGSFGETLMEWKAREKKKTEKDEKEKGYKSSECILLPAALLHVPEDGDGVERMQLQQQRRRPSTSSESSTATPGLQHVTVMRASSGGSWI